MTTIAYVDASALVKLIVAEPETSAMHRWYVEAERTVTSRLALVEVRRAVARRTNEVDPAVVDAVLASVDVVELDAAVGGVAGALPAALRTLDAIHLATALHVGDIEAFVTYDDRLADAAQECGMDLRMVLARPARDVLQGIPVGATLR